MILCEPFTSLMRTGINSTDNQIQARAGEFTDLENAAEGECAGWTHVKAIGQESRHMFARPGPDAGLPRDNAIAGNGRRKQVACLTTR